MSEERAGRVKIAGMLTIWRRHRPGCAHRRKGRSYLKCDCPIWADGYVNGRRVLRQSLGTKDLARARKKAVALEAPDDRVYKPVPDAVTAFLEHCESEGLKEATVKKYRNPLKKLEAFCETQQIDTLDEITTAMLDRFRAGRGIEQITASKELEILRVFFGFCVDRDWLRDNPARKIKLPRHLKPNEVVPFSAAEVAAIVKACDSVGQSGYERSRARAIALTLRYTALRIGDVSLLAKDRISRDGEWSACLPADSAGAEGGARLRAGAAAEHRVAVFLLEQPRQGEDAQGAY